MAVFPADFLNFRPKIGDPANISLIDYSHFHLKGCVAWWPMFEGAGPLYRDVMKGNNGTSNNGAVWTGGFPGSPFNKGALFDGTDSYVNVTDDAASQKLDITDALSIAVWVTPFDFSAANELDVIVTKGRPNGGDGETSNGPYTLQLLVDKYRFQITNDGDDNTEALVGSATTSAGNTDFVVATFSGGDTTNNMKLYLNGGLDNQTSNTGVTTLKQTNQDVEIGYSVARGTSRWAWDGIIWDLKIFNRELREGEIWQMYQYPNAMTRRSPDFFPEGLVSQRATDTSTSGITQLRGLSRGTQVDGITEEEGITRTI